MTRVKRGTLSMKRRRSILKRAKGYRFGRSTKERQAKEAVIHAGVHAFTHRRDKKGDMRRMWQTKINAASRELGLSYSKLAGLLTKKKIGLNRKMLAELAENEPESFRRVVEKVQS